MRWLLTGCGVLMIVVGGSCVISGYPIVEVERGWTLVIAGATVLSGGAIVLALGLTLAGIGHLSRSLALEMRAQTEALVGAAITVAQPETSQTPAPQAVGWQHRADQEHAAQLAQREHVDPSFPRDPQVVPVPAAPDEQPRPEPIKEADLATGAAPSVRIRDWKAPAFLRRQSPQEPALDETAAALAAPDLPPLREASRQQQSRAPEPTAEAAPLSSPEPAVYDSSPPPIEPPAPLEPPVPLSASDLPVHAEHQATPEPHFRRFPLRSLTLPRGPWPESPVPRAEQMAPVAENEQPPAREEQPPVQEEHPPAQEDKAPAKLAGEDWFERALAGLDDGADVGWRETRAAPAESTEESSGSSATSETAPAEPPEGEAPLPESESAEAVPLDSSTIIGRYETEGTTYVMYSDGSIDAETETGVYRFESLAALKAHIERST